MLVAELFSRLGLRVDEGSWTRGDRLISGMKGALAGLAGVFALHEVSEMIHSVAELADHASKASQILGITTESVQKLGYAAGLADVSQEQLEKGLGHLAIGLQEVAKGEGPAADAFKALHISAKQVKGLNLEQTLDVVADAFAKMPDGPQKIAAAMGIFGKAGKEMIPLLNGGSKEIHALGKEAEEMGIIVSGAAGKSFEEFNDNQRRLSETWRGLKTQIVTALLPTLNKLVTSLLEWVKGHREVIKSALDSVIRGSVVVVKAFATVIGYAVDALAWLSKHGDIAKGVLAGLAAVFAINKIAGAGAFLVGLGPLGLLVAGVAALSLGLMWLVDHWDAVTKAIRNAISAFGDWLVETASDAFGEGGFVGNAKKQMKDKQPSRAADVAPSSSASAPSSVFDTMVANAKQFGPTATIPPSPTVPAPGGTNDNRSITIGPTTIDVHAGPGMDEKAIAKIVVEKQQELHNASIKQAYESMRGGHK